MPYQVPIDEAKGGHRTNEGVSVKRTVSPFICTPVPYLPLLFQGVSASDLPWCMVEDFKLIAP